MSHNQDIRQAILSAANERGDLKTTCPSEIARALFPEDWRSHMKDVRDAAVALQEDGKVIISQRGVPVGNGPIKGPIRIRISKAG